MFCPMGKDFFFFKHEIGGFVLKGGGRKGGSKGYSVVMEAMEREHRGEGS